MLDRWSYYECFGDFPHTAEAAEELAKWREQDRKDEKRQAAQRDEAFRRSDERRRQRRAGLEAEAHEPAPAGQRPLSRWEKILARKPELRSAMRKHLADQQSRDRQGQSAS
ncbi:MAG: hypothetical protein AAF530_08450 [Pseudomonadota bacterium]